MAKKEKKSTAQVLEDTPLVNAFRLAVETASKSSKVELGDRKAVLAEMIALLNDKNLSLTQKDILKKITDDGKLDEFAAATWAKFFELTNQGKVRLDSKHTRQKTIARAICTAIADSGDLENVRMLQADARNKNNRGKLVDMLASRTTKHALFSAFNFKKKDTGSLAGYVNDLAAASKAAEAKKEPEKKPKRRRHRH